MLGFDADTAGIFVEQYEFGMSLPVPKFTVTPLSAPMATPLYSRLLAENRIVEHGSEAPAAFPWTTNIVPRQMTRAELIGGTRWLCNRLYRPVAFEHRITRFIDQYQAPAPRPNSGGRETLRRAVDSEHSQICRGVARLGPAEAAMVARLQKRLEQKPEASPLVSLALGYYMQIRFIYQTSGLWNPQLGAEPRPQFAPRDLTLDNGYCTEQILRVL